MCTIGFIFYSFVTVTIYVTECVLYKSDLRNHNKVQTTGNVSHTLKWNTHTGNKLKDLDEFLVPRVYDLNEVNKF